MKLSKETYNKLINNSIKVKESKYHNKKIMYDDIKFDSIKEKNRYQQLKLLELAGLISELELQKEFVLQPSYVNNNNKRIRAITYKADFVYFDKEKKKYIVEDVKGMRTEIYKLKKKILEYQYSNITIDEI